MSKWRVRATQKFNIFYTIEAETEAEALKKYEDIDCSLGWLDEDNPVSNEEYRSIEQVEA